jgi:retron-type reverse transcriptase
MIGKITNLGEGGQVRSDSRSKVRVMRNTQTTLEILSKRGAKKLPLERLYRLLFNPELYLQAYGKVHRNAGAMTAGTTTETVDGMSEGKIQNIISQIRMEKFAWTPVRRVEIPKGSGGTRPLGIPTFTDKLVQEVLRMILEAYYEPRFKDTSHGFRPRRGCHTALKYVSSWIGTVWFIEGDIAKCFDRAC